MPGRYIATGLYSEVVVNRGSTVSGKRMCLAYLFDEYNLSFFFINSNIFNNIIGYKY